MKYLLPILLLPLLAACSTVPEPIREPPSDGPGLNAVRSQPELHLGQTVRWGGTIAQINNHPNASHVEIVARPLHRNGEPRQVDQSDGRFIAIIPGFLDPAIHAPGRRLTVTGTVLDTIEQPLGKTNYRYPRIAAQAYYLWGEMQPDPWPAHPWYPYGYPYGPRYDPFWSPFWYPYPYPW